MARLLTSGNFAAATARVLRLVGRKEIMAQGLSMRAYYVLEAMRDYFALPGARERVTLRDLKTMHNCGPKTTAEITAWLTSQGYTLQSKEEKDYVQKLKDRPRCKCCGQVLPMHKAGKKNG